MQEVEVTWGHVVIIWWLIFWRTTVGAVVMGLGFGLVFGLLAAVTKVHINPLVFNVFGLVIGTFWWLIVIYMALMKQYSSFRIAIVQDRA